MSARTFTIDSEETSDFIQHGEVLMRHDTDEYGSMLIKVNRTGPIACPRCGNFVVLTEGVWTEERTGDPVCRDESSGEEGVHKADTMGVPEGHDYVLWWNDFVINEWVEAFTDLSLALARYALLIRCGEIQNEYGEGGFFRQYDAGDFATAFTPIWHQFIDPPRPDTPKETP